MPAPEPLHPLFKVDTTHFSYKEKSLLEARLFAFFCKALEEYFGESEKFMFESNLICLVLNDIISTGEYTLSGIAYHTHIPEEVIDDLVTGRNKNPSLLLARKIIDLHRTVKRDFYVELSKKT